MAGSRASALPNFKGPFDYLRNLVSVQEGNRDVIQRVAEFHDSEFVVVVVDRDLNKVCQIYIMWRL